MKELIGMGVALTTPFKIDGTVDEDALRNLVQHQIANNTDYIVVLGTTGEYATLNKEERTLVKDVVVEENDGKLPLVLGLGGNNTAQVVQRLKNEDCSGFDAILSVSPYYNKPSQEGIYQHFKQINEHTPLPVILYNVPGRTSSNVWPETVKRIAFDFDQIIGIKEAAGDLVQAMALIDVVPDDFLVISGDDIIALPMVLAGGAGVISVLGGGFPEELTKMINLGLNRKTDAAYTLHYALMPAMKLIFEEGNPAGIKVILHKLNLSERTVRLPLVSATEELQAKIHSFVDDFYASTNF